MQLPASGSTLNARPARLRVTIGLPVTVVAALPLKPTIQRIVGNMDGGLTFLGSAEPNSTVTISRTDGQFTSNVGSATANAAGTFSLVLTGLWVRSGLDAFTATSTNAPGQRGTSTGTFQLSGPGSDTLSGTTGQSDVFATFLRTGQDTIVGFETARAVGAAHDVINLSGTGYGSYSQVASHISGGDSAVIQLDATRSITVAGVSASMLGASDFRFS